MDSTRGKPDDVPLPGCNEFLPVLYSECASEEVSGEAGDKPKLVVKPVKDGWAFTGFLPYNLLTQPEDLLSILAKLIWLAEKKEMSIPGYLGRLIKLHDVVVDALEHEHARLLIKREGEPDTWIVWL